MGKLGRICNPCRTGIALVVVLSMILAGEVFAADVYYSPVPGDTELSWDNVNAWKNAQGSADVGRLPTWQDNVTLNNAGIVLPNMLRITNGVYAAAKSIGLGTIDAAAGRKIGLKVEAGGVLRASVGDYSEISLGDHVNGYGVLTIAGGTVSNRFITVGTRGIGVLTNDSGRIVICGTSENNDGNMNIGFASSATGTVVMTGGSISHLVSDGGWNHAIITVGASGHGTFEMSGGVVSNRMVVGTSRSGLPGSGTGVFKMSGGLFENRLFIGTRDSNDEVNPAGTGVAEITGGTVKGHVYVGVRGRGTLVVDGGTVDIPRQKLYGVNPPAPSCVSAGMYVGRYAGSEGHFVFKSGNLWFAEWSNLVVGHEGVGTADIFSAFSVPYIRLGGSSSGNMFTLHENVNLTVSKTCSIGGYALLEGADTVEYFTSGSGELVISNATVTLTSKDDERQLFVGRYDDSFGIIRGSGEFKIGGSASAIRMVLGHGQIIGDGFGSENVLDMHAFASVTNEFTNPMDGTNGWYAVNKGAVLFPRRWSTDSNITGVLGSWSMLTTPDMVNSVYYSVDRGSSSDVIVIHGGVYATDRTDLHLNDLPLSGNIVGVWKLGTATDVSLISHRDFSSVNLTFRYDHTKVTPGRMLKLYRWTGNYWSRVASAAANLANPCISSGSLSPLDANNIYKIGEFALVEAKSGLTVFVR